MVKLKEGYELICGQIQNKDDIYACPYEEHYNRCCKGCENDCDGKCDLFDFECDTKFWREKVNYSRLKS